MQASGTILLRASVDQEHVVFAVKDSGIGLDLRGAASCSTCSHACIEDEGHLCRAAWASALRWSVSSWSCMEAPVSATSPGRTAAASFTVRLPLSSTAAPVVAVDQNSPPLRGQLQPLRVLVADDNADALESLALLLEVCGHGVRKASDGQETLQAVTAGALMWRCSISACPCWTVMRSPARIRGEPWGTQLFLVAVSGWGSERGSPARHGGRLRPALQKKPIGLPILEGILEKAQRLNAETVVKSDS